MRQRAKRRVQEEPQTVEMENDSRNRGETGRSDNQIKTGAIKRR